MTTEAPPETLPDHTIPEPAPEPNPRDRYGIGPDLAAAFQWALAGVHLDPFFDPHQVIRPVFAYSIHNAPGEMVEGVQVVGGDAFHVEHWPDPIDQCRTIYANPCFSGGGTKKCLAMLHQAMGSGKVDAAIYVGPANLGSDYARTHAHPSLAAVAHLGRYDFIPLVNMPATRGKDGRIKSKARKAGDRSKGGSSLEVAAILMLGPRVEAASPLLRYVDRFDTAMRSLSVPVTFARGV